MSVQRWPTLSAALFAVVVHTILLGVAASLRVSRPREPHALVTITLMQPAAPLPVAEGGGETRRIVPVPLPPPNPPLSKPLQRKRRAVLKPPVTSLLPPAPPTRTHPRPPPPVLPENLPPPQPREEIRPQEDPRLAAILPTVPPQGAEESAPSFPEGSSQASDLEKAEVHHNGAEGNAHTVGAPASGSRRAGEEDGKVDRRSSASALAQPQYGVNPKPVYPLLARRMGAQGEVLLRVRVQQNGSVAAVELVRSSGFTLLDEAATRTVRDRWRFIPARLNGVAIESWVEVPIKFVLAESQARERERP